MSLQYLIDGYNVLYQMNLNASLDLQTQRQKLLNFIAASHPQGSSRNEVTVVFDGQSGEGGVYMSQGLRIVFSGDRSADDIIKEKIQSSTNPRVMIIVTDDREIQSMVRQCGGHIISVAEFLARKEKNVSKGKLEASSQRHLSWKETLAINEEMKNIWLKKKTRDKRPETRD